MGNGNTAAKGTLRPWQLILPGSLTDLDLKGWGNIALSPLSAPSSFRAQNLSCNAPASNFGSFV